MKCTTCSGEGRTDSNPDVSERAPWSFWASLPTGSDLAVRLGLVKPMDCAACDGKGTYPDPTPVTARTVLASIKAEAHAANPLGSEWTALTDPGDRNTAPAWIVDADDLEIRMDATYAAGKVAHFIAAAPGNVERLTRALEAALDACDMIIDNKDQHKPQGPPHPTQQQGTAIRIRAAVEGTLLAQP